MIHYSVVIPQRDSVGSISKLLHPLEEVLTGLLLPYEIICIDDASAAGDRNALEGLLAEHPRLRALRFDDPRGTSGALSAGVAAARGDLVIAVGLHNSTSVRYLPHLIAHLSLHDLVIAEPERPLPNHLCSRMVRLPRAWAGDRQLRPGEELFWAARREAVSGLALAPGAFRLLSEIMTRRGFRVGKLSIAKDLPVRSATFHPSAAGKLLAGWIDRRFEPHRASELAGDGSARSQFSVARPRVVAHPGLTAVEQQSHDSA